MKIRFKEYKELDCDYLHWALLGKNAFDKFENVIMLSCSEFSLNKYLQTVNDPSNYKIVQVDL